MKNLRGTPFYLLTALTSRNCGLLTCYLTNGTKWNERELSLTNSWLSIYKLNRTQNQYKGRNYLPRRDT